MWSGPPKPMVLYNFCFNGIFLPSAQKAVCRPDDAEARTTRGGRDPGAAGAEDRGWGVAGGFYRHEGAARGEVKSDGNAESRGPRSQLLSGSRPPRDVLVSASEGYDAAFCSTRDGWYFVPDSPFVCPVLWSDRRVHSCHLYFSSGARAADAAKLACSILFRCGAFEREGKKTAMTACLTWLPLRRDRQKELQNRSNFNLINCWYTRVQKTHLELSTGSNKRDTS